MTRQRFNRLSSAWIMTVYVMGISLQLQANEVQVGRYTLRSATPTVAQANLLAATVNIRFPDRIQTIGESVRQLLQGSGYRLANSAVIGPETKSLLLLPLPAVHRSLGPIPLRRALVTLAGPAFHLVQDPVHRLISFELCAQVGKRHPIGRGS